MKDSLGRYIRGSVPKNKIILDEILLRELYKEYGSTTIARKLNVSKQTVLRCFHEYNISIKDKSVKLPEYHKKSLRVPKSKLVWNKGQTKNTNKSLLQISIKLSGNNNLRWNPEIHTNEKILCKCGCGELINKYDKRGRIRYYKKGHNKENLFTSENASGKNSYSWKGGITSEHDKIRHSEIYNQWRLSIYERDLYKCQKCGSKKNIIAHHIKYFSRYPELRFDKNNGITLCRSCHFELHLGEKRLCQIKTEKIQENKVLDLVNKRANQGRGGCETTKKTGKGRK